MWQMFKNTLSYYINTPRVGSRYTGEFSVLGDSWTLGRKQYLDSPLITDRSTFKLTILSDSMPYYRCEVQVAVCSTYDGVIVCITRREPKRILKTKFKQMIIDGRLTRDEK